MDTLLGQSMRGDFHDRLGRTIAESLGQDSVQIERFRRRMWGGEDFSGNMVFDRPDQRASAIGCAEDCFEEKCGRTFPVGASDAGERQPLGRPLVEIRAQSRQRPAPMQHLCPSHSFTWFFSR